MLASHSHRQYKDDIIVALTAGKKDGRFSKKNALVPSGLLANNQNPELYWAFKIGLGGHGAFCYVNIILLHSVN